LINLDRRKLVQVVGLGALCLVTFLALYNPEGFQDRGGRRDPEPQKAATPVDPWREAAIRLKKLAAATGDRELWADAAEAFLQAGEYFTATQAAQEALGPKLDHPRALLVNGT
jgi:hypothetical protein